MRSPSSYRQNIPLFYSKTSTEFQKDPYERYDPMVIRQLSIHLVDKIWGGYPMQPIVDFTTQHYPSKPINHILDIGCGVGRWTGDLASLYPEAQCWGIDYSYQMLKQAHDYWKMGNTTTIDLSNRGLSDSVKLQGLQLSNINFGLAKASNLPFDDDSQDFIVSSFLIDRLDDPIAGIKEMHRILNHNGRMIIISPLNFQQRRLWDTFYPTNKIKDFLTNIGFQLIDWNDHIVIEEPLDLRGNCVRWKCLGMVVEKK